MKVHATEARTGGLNVKFVLAFVVLAIAVFSIPWGAIFNASDMPTPDQLWDQHDGTEYVNNSVSSSGGGNFNWDGHQHGPPCPGNAIQHIICCHAKGAGCGKSEFLTNSADEIAQLVETTLANGTHSAAKSGGMKAVLEFTTKVGTSSKGKALYRIKVYYDRATRAIRTAHPF